MKRMKWILTIWVLCFAIGFSAEAVRVQVNDVPAIVTTLTATGAVSFDPATDSTTLFQVLDADGGNPVLNVDSTNERVGIGTAAPATDLQVVGEGTFGDSVYVIIGDVLSGVHFPGIWMRTSSPTVTNYFMLQTTTEAILNTPSGDNFDFRANNDTKMRIYASGGLSLGASVVGTDPGANKVLIAGTLGVANSAPAGVLGIGSGTKHDGFIFRDAAELQTGNGVQQTLDNVTLLDENTYHLEACVVGVQSDGTDRASYHIAATVYRTGAGGATLQGVVTSLHTQESNVALDATFTVDTNDIRVSVTGIAAETWEWGATLKYMNMSN